MFETHLKQHDSQTSNLRNAYSRVVFLDSNHTSKFKHHLKFVWKILLQLVNFAGEHPKSWIL